MIIQQFEDKDLAHYSYAILSNGEMALIDPSRNPQPYYDFAEQHQVRITTIIETHPHADFVSSHLEIHKTKGATIFVSKLLGAEYPHTGFDEGAIIELGNITLSAINTPGHSPDSICILATNENHKPEAVFTGDTLFIGDCGRPDLRENAGAITATRKALAKDMYHSLRNKLINLPNDVLVYPAHGAGSLCGKELSAKNVSTIGEEKISNWSLQDMSEEEFVNVLLKDQPFIPKYFPYNVSLNKKGADNYENSIANVKIDDPTTIEQFFSNNLDQTIPVIDSRPHQQFKSGHIRNAINLMADGKFETWIGSIIQPGEQFYLIAEDTSTLNQLISRCAKIGYEKQIASAFITNAGNVVMPFFDSKELENNTEAFTIIDIRNDAEIKAGKIFSNALHIPLHQLRERTNEIPTNKPIVVHCAGGYRSAAGASIIQSTVNGSVPVYDLGEAIKLFQ